MRTYDLNIFYKERWNDELNQAEWDEVFTIALAIYTESNGVLDKTDLYEPVITCTRKETSIIREHFSKEEYGDDFWVFLPSFLNVCPSMRIADILNQLPELD